jgi:hypothetical protein
MAFMGLNRRSLFNLCLMSAMSCWHQLSSSPALSTHGDGTGEVYASGGLTVDLLLL